MFAVICVFWVVADLVPVALHYRGNTYDFVLEEVPLLIGLVFLSPNLLVLSAVCAVAFTFTVLRRQALMKVVFNVASARLGTALAATVYRELLGDHSPVSLLGWAAAAAGAGDQSGRHAPRLARRHHAERPEDAKRRTGIILLAIQAMLMAASMCLAFAFLDAAWYDPWATLPLLLVGALVIGAYRGYARLSLRFSSLQAPLRLQPDDGHGEPRALDHERGRPEGGLHGHAGPPGRAHPGRAVGYPPPDHLRRDTGRPASSRSPSTRPPS